MLRCTIRISSYALTHHFIISYRNNHATSSDVASPQTTSLSYSIITPPSRRFLRVSQCLRLSVTQFLPHHRERPPTIPKYLCTFQRRDKKLRQSSLDQHRLWWTESRVSLTCEPVVLTDMLVSIESLGMRMWIMMECKPTMYQP
jgi:hypothetical protein